MTDFPIVNFPDLSSNIPESPAIGSYAPTPCLVVSQLCVSILLCREVYALEGGISIWFQSSCNMVQ